MTHSVYSHSAVFAEVSVDEDLGTVHCTRVVSAIAGGRILNPKTARSQIMGAIVWGISMALEEESMMDHNLGRFMNHNYAEYHIPVNADIHDIEVIFVPEHDDDGQSARRERDWARSAWSAWRRRWRTRCSTRPASACATCRSRWINCCDQGVFSTVSIPFD